MNESIGLGKYGTARPLRAVLVHAYACDPGEGSEPGAGWQAAMAGLAVANEVWILTRHNNVAAVQAGLRALGASIEQRSTVVGFDLGPVWNTLKRVLPGGVQIYYMAWQVAAARKIRELHRLHLFNAGMHATFAIDWLPTALQWVPGLPYVWGPVGGSSKTPLKLYGALGARGIVSEIVRLVGPGLARAVAGDAAARGSALTLAQNEDVATRFARVAPTRILPNAAPVVPDRIAGIDGREGADLIAVGRLLPWKGLSLAIKALARPECANLSLRIYGEGPDERRLRRIANRSGVSARVVFEGQRPRSEVLSAMSSAKALVFPSFHDSSPWTVAEALALGCPVVALDLGGSATLLRGAGLEPVKHRSEDLVRTLALNMADPPTSVRDLVWTPEAFTEGVGSALLSIAQHDRGTSS